MDITSLIPVLLQGGLGGLVGGNILGRIGKGSVGQNSLVGIIGGAIATYFFGPTYGPMLGGLVGSGLEQIVGNLGVGAVGGGGLGLIISLLRSMMSR